MKSPDISSSKSGRQGAAGEEVIRAVRGRAGVLSFRRPETLNAIDETVVVRMTDALLDWRTRDEVDLVVLDFANPGGLTFSGTDVRFLARCASWDFRQAISFFAAQYRLIDLIRRYDKPVVAFLNGRLLGGAIGLAMAAPHRIVTPDAAFQFPETRIGLAPDCGSSWYLSRLKNQIGFWLALTGAELRGSDLVWAGLATRIEDASGLEQLKESVFANGTSVLDQPQPVQASLPNSACEEMVSCFSEDTIDAVISKLSSGSDWARQQADRISKTCPLSAGIALRQLQTGLILSEPREALRLEFRILSRLVCTRNFREGVRSVLLEPNSEAEWDPPSFARVTSNRLAPYFAPPREGELKFIDLPALDHAVAQDG
ncbi:MAG: enoyl-CoA hydratase/isomerase family protein [Pseudomonadota bacterium]|nr:enoyl-CoA hydratase/isomerase family protein [Pseudomonadota bacterium]